MDLGDFTVPTVIWSQEAQPVLQTVLAWFGSFLSLLLIGGMQQWINQRWSLPLLLSTFGPSCALIFGLPTLPASQPMNCFGKMI